MKRRTVKDKDEDEDTETPNLDKDKVIVPETKTDDKDKDLDLKTKFSELEKKYLEQGEKLDKVLDFISKSQKEPEAKTEIKPETKTETKPENPDYIKKSDLDKLLEERDKATMKKVVLGSLTADEKKVLEAFPKWESLDAEQIQVVIGKGKVPTNKVTFPDAQSGALANAQPLTVGSVQKDWDNYKKENGL